MDVHSNLKEIFQREVFKLFYTNETNYHLGSFFSSHFFFVI